MASYTVHIEDHKNRQMVDKVVTGKRELDALIAKIIAKQEALPVVDSRDTRGYRHVMRYTWEVTIS